MKILDKNLLILASAGSGKTFQLANRIIGLVAHGVSPEKIVALTFTRKAAGEFADALLTKLASAADDPTVADRLRRDLNLPDADFSGPLQQVVRALPRLTLGTMDGFFSKVVRGFQYELGLTGGPFQMIEGPQAETLMDGVLLSILGNVSDTSPQHGFVQAFRRATIGREKPGIASALRDFVGGWQAIYQEFPDLDWGPSALFTRHPEEWEKAKSPLAASALNGLGQITYTDKRQQAALETAISKLEAHTIGSGSLGSGPTLLDNILAAAREPGDSLTVKCWKDFTITGTTAQALRSMVALAAACEIGAAILRTRALREVVSAFDHACDMQLRRNGRLGFHDIKLLMGRWATSEDARLRREAVDFRLDSRIDHWLLDEFQDTSRADWNGLSPLVDEVASDNGGSVFIVGDKKQAIYGWRGGDVSLFDDIIGRYGGNLTIEPMDVSWRSCPEVLSLVNRVCGDSATLNELFGEAAEHWPWQEHESAPPLKHPDKRGEARVEMIGSWEERLERLPALLTELGVGARAMTCGILLRGNDKVRQVAEHLRAQGFEVVEEGRRKPATDNPPGLLVRHLLRWLANPADRFSREVLAMSPAAPHLRQRHGGSWRDVWSALTLEISRLGFGTTVRNLMEPVLTDASAFGRLRTAELLSALDGLDRAGETSVAAAADWLERLEVSQTPGDAAVQVMTIHKSKGLGFDTVVLPDIPDDSLPQAARFDIASTEEWLTETPPKWARETDPALTEAGRKWGLKQCYEAFCTLYVALTRAKRGLYVFLEPPAKTSAADKPSLANWLARSAGPSQGPESIIYQNGNPSWTANLPPLAGRAARAATPALCAGRQTPRRVTPTGLAGHVPVSATGASHGRAVHQLLESLEWLDHSHPTLPPTPTGRQLARFLELPDVANLLSRRGREIDLFREQPVAASVNGAFLTGTIDRLHLHRTPDGITHLAEIIDYKTDAVDTASNLVERHHQQISAYRESIRLLHPGAEIRCYLLSTHLAAVIEIPA